VDGVDALELNVRDMEPHRVSPDGYRIAAQLIRPSHVWGQDIVSIVVSDGIFAPNGRRANRRHCMSGQKRMQRACRDVSRGGVVQERQGLPSHHSARSRAYLVMAP
jgi:hypothetical protein